MAERRCGAAGGAQRGAAVGAQVRPAEPGELRLLGLASVARPGPAGTGERGTERAGREGGGALVAPMRARGGMPGGAAGHRRALTAPRALESGCVWAEALIGPGAAAVLGSPHLGSFPPAASRLDSMI